MMPGINCKDRCPILIEDTTWYGGVRPCCRLKEPGLDRCLLHREVKNPQVWDLQGDFSISRIQSPFDSDAVTRSFLNIQKSELKLQELTRLLNKLRSSKTKSILAIEEKQRQEIANIEGECRLKLQQMASTKDMELNTLRNRLEREFEGKEEEYKKAIYRLQERIQFIRNSRQEAMESGEDTKREKEQVIMEQDQEIKRLTADLETLQKLYLTKGLKLTNTELALLYNAVVELLNTVQDIEEVTESKDPTFQSQIASLRALQQRLKTDLDVESMNTIADKLDGWLAYEDEASQPMNSTEEDL